MDVEALDVGERAAGADELRDYGHFLVCVERHAGAVEVADAHAVAVEVAAVLVADAAVAVVAVTTGGARAFLETGATAGVRGVGCGNGICFPDVHFWAAGADFTLAGVGIVGRGVPAFDIGFTIDELNVVWALGVTVSSSIFGAGFVVALVQAAISGHFDKVEGAVETTGQLGNVHVKGELLADQVEHLIFGVGLHEIGARADVARVLALGDEFEGQGIAAGGDPVGARVVSTINGAVLGASHAIRAGSGVPRVAIEAVGVSAGNMGPTPVGVKNNRSRLAGAAVTTGPSASLPCHLGMSFSLRGTNLLGAGGPEEGERSEGECPVHLDC